LKIGAEVFCPNYFDETKGDFRGWKKLLPFTTTVLGIVFKDLLVGIGLGLALLNVILMAEDILKQSLPLQKLMT